MLNKKNEDRVKELRKKRGDCAHGKCLEINIVDTWGDIFYTGLSGMQILDKNMNEIKIDESMIDAKPRDMNSIPGYSGDYRTLEKLYNGVNNICDDKNMWLIPFDKGQAHTITINFKQVKAIKGVKLWNYNKSEEDSLRGSKTITVKLDGKMVTPKRGVILRKASGRIDEGFNYGQFVPLPYTDGWSNDQIMRIKRELEPVSSLIHQEYETPLNPIGFIYKFSLHSTHKDPHYIGLNGIEIYDHMGNNLTDMDVNIHNPP